LRELSKSIPRRQRDPNFITKYFVGSGIDIGGLPDPLSLYVELFPLITNVRIWDREDGDAQLLSGIQADSVDFIVSSHCLEHLLDPYEGLKNWIRVLKPGGHLIITIPDEDLYEQGQWPSDKNLDHKHTFTVNKQSSWSPRSINLFHLLAAISENADVRKIEVLDASYRFNLPDYDQTMTPIGESAIEVIVRKKTNNEVLNGTNRVTSGQQPSSSLRRYFNQYHLDYRTMKLSNNGSMPFTCEDEL
jgi:SAM-dependent methyltransferase